MQVDSISRAVRMEVIASLGNLRIADSSFEQTHLYHWILDRKDSRSDSLVELRFQWFHQEADSMYPGWDYCLEGKLSAVRVVFLYRFFMQLIAYFCGLCPPSPPTSGSTESLEDLFLPAARPWWSMKLDVSLTEPLLFWPRHSQSPDAMEISMESLQVRPVAPMNE